MYKSNKSKKNFNTSDTVCPPRYLYNIYFRAIFCSILAVFWLRLTANMLISKPMRCLRNLSFHFRIIPLTFALENSCGFIALDFVAQIYYFARRNNEVNQKCCFLG